MRKRNSGHALIELFVLIVLVLSAIGWVANLYHATQLDFEAPYKAEAFRIIGIPVAPLGGVLGYITFNEEW